MKAFGSGFAALALCIPHFEEFLRHNQRTLPPSVSPISSIASGRE